MTILQQTLLAYQTLVGLTEKLKKLPWVHSTPSSLLEQLLVLVVVVGVPSYELYDCVVGLKPLVEVWDPMLFLIYWTLNNRSLIHQLHTDKAKSMPTR